MTRLEGPESGDGGGFELWRDPSPSSRPCAFCRQEIGQAPSTSCRKCGTFYHPDCWAANDGRCAVYGCAPLSAPPPPAPPPPRPRRVPTWTPEPPRTFSFSGLGRGWTIGLVIIVINVIRIVSMQSTRSSSERPQINYKEITERNRDFSNRNRSLSKMLLKLIEASRQKGNLAEALKYADQAVQMDPNYAPAYHLRGDLKVDMGDLQGAVSDYTRTMDLDPADTRAIYDRGCAYFDLQNWQECIKDFARGYSNSTSMKVPSQLRFCLARARMGQREAAERDLATILADRGNYVDPWGQELLRFVVGQSSEEALLDEAERAPAEWRYQAYFYAGEVRLLNGDPEEAKVLLKRCIELGSKDDRECKSAAAELRALEKH